MVYQTIFRSVVFRLQSSEESLLGAEDLDSRSRMFRQIHQTSSMTDESCTDELSDQRCEIWSDRLHPVSEIFGKLSSVFGNGDDLVAERVDVGDIGVGDFGSHG